MNGTEEAPGWAWATASKIKSTIKIMKLALVSCAEQSGRHATRFLVSQALTTLFRDENSRFASHSG